MSAHICISPHRVTNEGQISAVQIAHPILCGQTPVSAQWPTEIERHLGRCVVSEPLNVDVAT